MNQGVPSEPVDSNGTIKITTTALTSNTLSITSTVPVNLELSKVQIWSVVTCIYAQDADLNIVLTGENHLDMIDIGELPAFKCGNVNFSGNGSLVATAHNYCGMDVDGDMTVNGGTITATTDSNNTGIICRGNLVVTAGNLTGSGSSGNTNRYNGIDVNNSIDISGGTITGTGGNGGIGIRADDITISNSGNVTGTGIAGDGIFARNRLTITGGTVHAESTNDSYMDNYAILTKSFEMNGGNVTVEGHNADIFYPDIDGGSFYIKNGHYVEFLI